MKNMLLVFIMLAVSCNIMGYNKKNAFKTVQKYQKVSKAALEELDTEKAKKNLLKAISLIESYKFNEKSFADVYISAGVLNLMIDDGGEALTYFKKALKLNPSVKIPENFSSEDIEAVFKKAKKATSSGDDGEGESFTFDTVTYNLVYNAPLYHTPKKPFKVTVKANPLPPSGYSILAMYVKKGEESYESLKLTRSDKNLYEGMIPADDISSKGLSLYILMIDNDFNPIAMSGSESKPFKIQIKDKSVAKINDDLDMDDDQDIEDKEKSKKINQKKDYPLVAIGLNAGTGVGIAYGKPLYTKLNINPGLAWSPAWFSPSLFFYATPELMIGISSRIQFIETALNLSLKGKVLVYNADSYKLFTDFGIGYGEVKYQVDVSKYHPEQNVDVLVHKNFWVNSGVSFVYMLSKNFGLEMNANINLVFIPKVSVLMDVGAGLYVEF